MRVIDVRFRRVIAAIGDRRVVVQFEPRAAESGR